jgi:hypothetical protein
MSDTSLALRLAGSARISGSRAAEMDLTERSQAAAVEQKSGVRSQKPAMDPDWRRPEWWQSHHYGRR